MQRIALNGFRNYEWETAEFAPGTNVICGPNAQGKTNLLEAVYMLAMGRSFRTRFDKELVGFDADGADILADVTSHGREQTVNIRLTPGRPKRILVNAVRKNAGELSDTVNTVLFCPDDLNLIKSAYSSINCVRTALNIDLSAKCVVSINLSVLQELLYFMCYIKDSAVCRNSCIVHVQHQLVKYSENISTCKYCSISSLTYISIMSGIS